jgi:ACR3 family arsenite efflux pump ArsB
MMIGIKFDEVKKALLQWKMVMVAMILNFLISPLLAAFLANIFLANQPDFAVGLILTGTVPCAGMIIAWTGLAKEILLLHWLLQP